MTTATVPAELEHLDFTPAPTCEFDHEAGYCAMPAEYRVTIAFPSVGGEVVQHYCARHAIGLVSHLALCPGCSGLYRIVDVVRVR